MIYQLFISLFGAPAFLLVTQDAKALQKWGTCLGIISQAFWWWMFWDLQQWGMLPVYSLYTYGWASKAWRLWGGAAGILTRNG